MLAFYGLGLRESGAEPAIERAAHWPERSSVWLTPYNHNHLRLTRMMKSLVLLGLPELARALRTALLREAARASPGTVSSVTLEYWRNAGG